MQQDRDVFTRTEIIRTVIPKASEEKISLALEKILEMGFWEELPNGDIHMHAEHLRERLRKSSKHNPDLDSGLDGGQTKRGRGRPRKYIEILSEDEADNAQDESRTEESFENEYIDEQVQPESTLSKGLVEDESPF